MCMPFNNFGLESQSSRGVWETVTVFGKGDATGLGYALGSSYFRGLPFERFGSLSSGVDEGGR